MKFHCIKCHDTSWIIKCNCYKICDRVLPYRDKDLKPHLVVDGHTLKSKMHEERFFYDKYWWLTKPNYWGSNSTGKVMEHVYNFQEHYKCCMLPWGSIHHIDRNKNNNDISNLQGMIDKKHWKLHADEMIEKKEIKKEQELRDRRCCKCRSKNTKVTPDNKGEKIPRWYRLPSDKVNWYCHKCYVQWEYYYRINKVISY